MPVSMLGAALATSLTALFWLGALVGLALALVPARPAHAGSAIAESLRLLVDDRLAGTGADVEIEVGEPDPRLNLAPCARVEPFIPPGARLSGRTSLGVRCVEGPNWSIYLPVQIRLLVDALIVARPVARGQPVTPADVRIERIDIAPLRGNALLAAESPEGRTATRALQAGEPLRRDLLRAPAAFSPGDAVQVLAQGPGFTARSVGKALTAAADGQNAQVAMPGGRVVTGIARSPASLEVR
jgi:flagella basal body P-ring formation protein FlgA